MPPSLIEPTEAAPQFTECVSEKNGGVPSPGNSRQVARRLQELIEQIQQHQNPAARALLQECLQLLLGFYGEGLSHLVTQMQSAGSEGRQLLERLLKDEAISRLLLIHGLHPDSLETRLQRALDSVRPYMQSHGGNIELLSLENDIARIKLEGTCKSCPSSTITLDLAVRRAVEESCPDILGFEVVQAGDETQTKV